MNGKTTDLKPTRMRTHPHTTRSRLMLEVASQLVNRKDFPYLQARISLREQGADEWPLTLFASDSPATIDEVAAGKVQFAIINPSMILKLAALGSAPFKEPIPLRVIAVLPALDQMVFAVKRETGLNSFSDIRARKFPLRVSLRAQPDHSLHLIVDHVLESGGIFSGRYRFLGRQSALRRRHGLRPEPHRRDAARRDRRDLRRGRERVGQHGAGTGHEFSTPRRRPPTAIGIGGFTSRRDRNEDTFPSSPMTCKRSTSAAGRFTHTKTRRMRWSPTFAARLKKARSASRGPKRRHSRSRKWCATRRKGTWKCRSIQRRSVFGASVAICRKKLELHHEGLVRTAACCAPQLRALRVLREVNPAFPIHRLQAQLTWQSYFLYSSDFW